MSYHIPRPRKRRIFFLVRAIFRRSSKKHTTNSFGVDFCHFCVVFCHFCVILASCFLSRICCMFLRHVFWRDGKKDIVSGSRYTYIYVFSMCKHCSFCVEAVNHLLHSLLQSNDLLSKRNACSQSQELLSAQEGQLLFQIPTPTAGGTSRRLEMTSFLAKSGPVASPFSFQHLNGVLSSRCEP